MAKEKKVLVFPTAPCKLGNIKSVMFHARDAKKHTLCWSSRGKAWMVENYEKGLIITRPNFIQGLSELERFSGVPCEFFEITENPYGGA